ncbi:hypothetical protein I3843_16G115700 [Carya illinoinensis]|nr:hypothetical protein I3843_16G115700 [Carya illinoinensis]
MASTGAAAEGIFRCLYESCISSCDTWIERRPYHRNCTCALHKPRSGSSHVVSNNMCRSKNVSYPMRRSWSEGSLALHAAASSNYSSPSSSSLLVVGAAAARGPQSSSLFVQDEEDDDQYGLFRI